MWPDFPVFKNFKHLAHNSANRYGKVRYPEMCLPIFDTCCIPLAVTSIREYSGISIIFLYYHCLMALCPNAFRWSVKFPLVRLYNRPIVMEPIG